MVLVPARVAVVVAVLAVLIRVRTTVLAGIAMRAVVAGGSRDSRWRPSRRRRTRCCERGRRADPGHEQPGQRENLRSVQSQSCHHGAFPLPLRKLDAAHTQASQTPPPAPLASHVHDGHREHERPRSRIGYTVVGRCTTPRRPRRPMRANRTLGGLTRVTPRRHSQRAGVRGGRARSLRPCVSGISSPIRDDATSSSASHRCR